MLRCWGHCEFIIFHNFFLSSKSKHSCFFLFLDQLTDQNIARFSEYITSEQELHNIGTGALKLRKTIIDNALHDKKDSIQGAAREVLYSWRNMQTENAYPSLHAALRKRKMNQLAEILRKLVEEDEDSSQETEESRK